MNPIRCKASFSGRFCVVLAVLAFCVPACPGPVRAAPRRSAAAVIIILTRVPWAWLPPLIQLPKGKMHICKTGNCRPPVQWPRARLGKMSTDRCKSQAASRPTTVSDSGQVARDWMFQHRSAQPTGAKAHDLAGDRIWPRSRPLEKPSQPAAPGKSCSGPRF